MSNEITVTVSGHVGIGKTALIAKIAELLVNEGINVRYSQGEVASEIGGGVQWLTPIHKDAKVIFKEEVVVPPPSANRIIIELFGNEARELIASGKTGVVDLPMGDTYRLRAGIAELGTFIEIMDDAGLIPVRLTLSERVLSGIAKEFYAALILMKKNLGNFGELDAERQREIVRRLADASFPLYLPDVLIKVITEDFGSL